MSGVNYHAWTHRPKALGGTDPIESSSTVQYARFQRISDSDITVFDATNTVVTGTSGQDVITSSALFQINSNSEIQMKADGVVAIWGQTVWGTYNTTFRQVYALNVTPAPDVILAMSGSGSDLFDAVLVAGVVRVVSGARIKLVVNQHSGIGHTIYGGGSAADQINFLEVQYLGVYA